MNLLDLITMNDGNALAQSWGAVTTSRKPHDARGEDVVRFSSCIPHRSRRSPAEQGLGLGLMTGQLNDEYDTLGRGHGFAEVGAAARLFERRYY